MVPASFGCGSAVLAAIATLAPSLAARSAIARPMPRLPPETNSVLPLSVVMTRPRCAPPAGASDVTLRESHGVAEKIRTRVIRGLGFVPGLDPGHSGAPPMPRSLTRQ